MAMNSSSSHNQTQYHPQLFFFFSSSSCTSLFFSVVIILLLQLLVICPSATSRGLLFEEKTRLGSRPPSCHNKCNQCHPCMAVQVPTLPGQNRVDPTQIRSGWGYIDELGYSNYKPLGWKCLCKDRFFNP